MNQGAWRRNLRLWAPPLFFCLLNLAFLAGYRLILAEEAELGRSLLDRRAAELERLKSVRDELGKISAQARETEEGIETYYRERLSTEEGRLTGIISEIKELAQRAGLEPGTIRYERETIARQDVVERTLVFNVFGGYPQLRQLVNLLELSDSFLILKEVSLSTADETGERLGIQLQIATLFAEGTDAEEREGGSA